MKTTHTTCPYCGVGCGVLVHEDAKGNLSVSGDPEHPANFGRLCSKGMALMETIHHPQRLLHPMIDQQRVTWAQATNTIAQRLQRMIQTHGADAIAFYVSGQLLTEDYYVANKLMKGFIGSANIDTNSRLCMSSAVAAHKRAFGEDLVPCHYEDIEAADLVVLIGSNAAWCHPVLYQRLVKAKQTNPLMKVVVIDPRRTATADIADLYLALKPSTDAYLFNGLLHYLAQQGCVATDYVTQFTEGMESALQAAQKSTASIARVAEQCALPTALVQQFFALFAHSEKVVSLFSQGINQSSSGVDKGNALINCHLLTGRIGKLGMGPFSLTGQPNAMGGREVGGLANQLAAHLDIDNPQHQALVQDFWQSPTIACQPGLKAVELFEAVRHGKVKAIWIMATNPAVSLPHLSQVREALQQCELVIVSDCVTNTDTLQYAHVRLPAQTWGERNGTVTNSERIISRQRPFLPSVGEAKPDWQIITEVAQAMGFGSAFPYQNAGSIFREHAALSAYRNQADQIRCFNIGALADLSTQNYDALTPVRWPLSAPRLFADGKFFTASGRARFIAVTPTTAQSTTSPEWPLVLNTGRIRDHWHTLTRTGISERLSAHYHEAHVMIHSLDAKQRGIEDGTLVRIFNALGEVIVRAEVTENQPVGSLFMPIHWNREFASTATVGDLIPAIVDPISGQPESKHAAVQAAAFPVAWQGFMLSRRKPLACDFSYWSVHRIGGIWHYQLAGNTPQADWQTTARRLLCHDHEAVNWIEYLDDKRQTYRAARLLGGKLESCLFISPSIATLPAIHWLEKLFQQATLNENERRNLLAGRDSIATPDVGKIVCSCFNIGEKTLKQAIIQHKLQTPEALGQHLKAGTNCGSCLPELRVLCQK